MIQQIEISMKKLYQDIQNYWNRKKADSIYVSIIRAIILFAGGILITHGLRESSIMFGLIGVILTLLYTRLEYQRMKIEEDFPIKILDHLTASEELATSKKELKRKIIIDKYISNSIVGLNNSTCPVLFSPNSEICKQDLAIGLKDILEDIVQRINYVLDIDESEFTIGVFINGYFKKILDYKEGTKLEQHGSFFVLRDDLNLKNELPPDITDISKSYNNALNIHKTIIETINHSKYVTDCIDLNEIGHTIISSPIPSCSNTPDGVIFVLHQNQTTPIPSDLKEVLKIYGGLVSNWISKYNSCVWEDFERKKRKFYDVQENDLCIEVSDVITCSVCFPEDENESVTVVNESDTEYN